MQRAVACLAIAVYAIGQWAAIAHNAEARHVRCAEHGELVDVRRVALVENHFDDAGLATLVGRTDKGHATGEEHCGFAAASRPTLGAHATILDALTLPAAARVATLSPTTSSHSRLLLLVAPKTSPPGTSSRVQSHPGFLSHSDEVLVCVRPSLFSVSPSPAARPSCTATSARSSIRHLVA